MDRQLAKRLSTSFKDRFGSFPFLIWSPGRINLIGEHTDYNYGYVMPAAIDRGICLALQKSENSTFTWIALDPGETYQSDVYAGVPVKPTGWQAYFHGVLAELKKIGIKPGPYNLIFSGNLPPGAGLSSSAALENGFVFGLNELFNLGLSRMDMVRISHAAEQDYVGVKCGIMDQYASMFGKSGQAIFLDCRSLESELIPVQMDGYEWLLLDTGVKHNLAETAYNERRKSCETVASLLGVSSLRELSLSELEQKSEHLPEQDYIKARYVLEENARVLKASKAMRHGDLSALGRLMYESHNGLQHQYRVSCRELDFLVEMARGSDAILGARMMGGGFGGCTLNLVRKDHYRSLQDLFLEAYHQHFKQKLSAFTVSMANGCQRLQTGF